MKTKKSLNLTASGNLEKMIKNFRRVAISLLLAVIVAVGGGATVYAAKTSTFGNSLSGASNTETLNIKYTGKAWNKTGSGYTYTYFTYSRNGQVLLTKYAYSGTVTGSVWDSLRWGKKYTTIFKWNHK